MHGGVVGDVRADIQGAMSHDVTLTRATPALMAYKDHKMQLTIPAGQTVRMLKEIQDGHCEVHWDGDTFLVRREYLDPDPGN